MQTPNYMKELPEELIRVLGLLYVHAAVYNTTAGCGGLLPKYLRELTSQLLNGAHRAKDTDALYDALLSQDVLASVREVKRLAAKAIDYANGSAEEY